MSAISIATKIVQSPEILGGQPHIENRRIRVKDIVSWFESLGMSADEIADTYDLTLADVYSALAYYHQHQLILKEKWDAEQQQVAALKITSPSKINLAQVHAKR